MTALEKYVRLESLGVWREGPGLAPREVVVSFGNATLMLRNGADQPLGHWALAGIQPIGTDGAATIYAMTPEGDETLAIADPEMIAALGAVTRAAPSARRGRRRGRPPLGLILMLALLTAGIVYGPDLPRDQASRMMPPEQAREYGDRMLLGILETKGKLCADPAGARALGRLGDVVAGDAPLRVLDLGGAPRVAILPGPTILIDRAALASARTPEELAAWITLALGPDPERTSVRALMTAAGPLDSLGYVFTGHLGDAALARATAASLAAPAYASDFLPAAADRPISDQDWAALRGICG